MGEKYPNTKEVVYLLGMGTLLLGSILMPGLGLAAGALARAKKRYDWKQTQKEWQRFNHYYLRKNLRRLYQQKIVEIIEQDGQEVVKLTQKGRTKYLRFQLEELSLKGRAWDKKWRIVLYDISKFKRSQQETFRRILKRIRFLKLQKSVYITPYSCEESIEYLREYFGIGREVLVIRADKIENEVVYKKYFGL